MKKSSPDIKQLFIYLMALATILTTAGCLLQQYFIFPENEPAEEQQYSVVPAWDDHTQPFEEVFLPPEPEITDILPHPGTLPDQGAPEIDRRPRVAVIIDDMGFQKELGRKLLKLPLNLTFSFLPTAPYTKEQELLAYEQGRDVLLHLPMEPHDKNWNPGASALYLTTSRIAMTQTINDYLELVPHAIGANNHMGSRFTENRRAMRNVLHVLQQKGMFFIDSFTSAKTVGMAEAAAMGIPTARRNVFLDNEHTQKNVCHQLELLITVAKRDGSGIGIGHPNEATLAALTRCGKKFLDEVELVSAHELIGKPLTSSENTAW